MILSGYVQKITGYWNVEPRNKVRTRDTRVGVISLVRDIKTVRLYVGHFINMNSTQIAGD